MKPRRGADDLFSIHSTDVLQALEEVQVPAFAADLDRRVRWLNAAGIALVGDVRGKFDQSFVVPEDMARVREAVARKQLGAQHTDYEVTLIDCKRRRVRVAVSSVPLKGAGDTVIGSFGLLVPLDEPEPHTEPKLSPPLTARQRQTLTLLAAGRSTPQMAEVMGLSEETVRNHVKRLLRRLDARSRVEAVAKARRKKLV
jgi:DNA-binding CsgD family transcriptional regulator